MNKVNINKIDIKITKNAVNVKDKELTDDNILNNNKFDHIHNSNTKSNKKCIGSTVNIDEIGGKRNELDKALDISAINGTFDDFLIKDSEANENGRKSL